MSFKVIVISLLCFMITKPIQKQPHLIHQWEYRVLLIISNNYNHPDVRQQLKDLQKDLEAFKERKLILYQLYPEGMTKGFNQSSVEMSNKDWYQFYTNDKPLEVILFGLDGGKKLYSNTIVTLDELVAIIDAMPMRKSELKQYD